MKRRVRLDLPPDDTAYGLVLPLMRSDTEIVYQLYYSLHIVFSHGLVAGQAQFFVVDKFRDGQSAVGQNQTALAVGLQSGIISLPPSISRQFCSIGRCRRGVAILPVGRNGVVYHRLHAVAEEVFLQGVALFG